MSGIMKDSGIEFQFLPENATGEEVFIDSDKPDVANLSTGRRMIVEADLIVVVTRDAKGVSHTVTILEDLGKRLLINGSFFIGQIKIGDNLTICLINNVTNFPSMKKK